MSLLEKMLIQKKETLQSISNQLNIIDEISGQSNNLLLEIQSERSNEVKNMKISPNMKAYKYSKKIDEILPKAIELHQRLRDKNETFADKSAYHHTGLSDFLQENQENSQYLSNNVRKTIAVADILEKVIKDEMKAQDSNE